MTIIADPSGVLTVVSVSTGLGWKMNACRVCWCCLEHGNSNVTESDNCSRAGYLVQWHEEKRQAGVNCLIGSD